MPIFRLVVSLGAIAALLLALSWLYVYNRQTTITNYQQCMDAGYPIMTTYPTQCRTPDGRVFVGPTDPQVTADPSIQVEMPKPGATVAQKVTVAGSARGSWFFEAVFPVKVVDTHGVVIAQTQAHAIGDWMTEESVDFTAQVALPTTYTGAATIIFEKANPSGLPERSAAIQVPVIVK